MADPQNTDATKTAPAKAAVPAPLPEENLWARIDALAVQLKKSGCNDNAKKVANRLVDNDFGGTGQNLINAVPALADRGPGSVRGYVSGADIDGDQKVDTLEKTALLLAAVNLAQRIQPSDIKGYLQGMKPDESYFKEVKRMCEVLDSTRCTIPKINPVTGKPVPDR